MPHHSSVLRIIGTLLFLAALLPASNRAGTWVAFQNTYTRGAGAPVTVTNTFTLLNPATQYTLKAFNGGLQNSSTELVSSSFVLLNGVQVIGPSDFSQSVAEVNVTIFPGLTNTVSVQVRGQPGGVLTVQVIGVDNDPPIINATPSAQPNAAGWYNSPVTVNFACSDKTSGVASCPSPVTVSAEAANQVVSGTATDLAGNTAPASYTVNLDMTPPTITATINPPPDAAGYNSGPVTVTFTCGDTLSGVGSCPAPVSVTTEGAGQLINVVGTDRAGNQAQLSVTVNISLKYFFMNSYEKPWTATRVGKCLDYGTSPSGATVFLNDCLSSPSQTIRVVEIAPRDQKDSQGNTIPLCSSQDNPPPNPPTPHTFCHEVMLFAGNQVIGVGSPTAASCASCPPSTTTTPPTEYSLELQPPWYSLAARPPATPANQIWRLDGDSIILEGTYTDSTGAVIPGPCINTVASTALCPPPPPQLVIKVQNARGANGSPLVAGVRNLADNEFWDFLAAAGPGIYPTSGFISTVPPVGGMPITTNWQLWNALCASPQATSAGPTIYSDMNNSNYGKPVPCGTLNVGWGSVVVVAGSDPSECTSRPDVGPCIDLSGYAPITLPAGVTIRGNRRGTSFGAQLFASYANDDPSTFATYVQNNESYQCDRTCMLLVTGDYARFTGLRMHGQRRDPGIDANTLRYNDAIIVSYAGSAVQPLPSIPPAGLSTVTELIATIDHNDISDWIDGAVRAVSPFSNSSSVSNLCSYFSSDPVTMNQITISYVCGQMSYGVAWPPPLTIFAAISQDPFASGPGTLANVHVTHNFLHHNMANNGGYGVSEQGRSLIERNTFLSNRHDISSDGEPHHQYRASHNLVLSSAYEHYGTLGGDGRLQDFDMHGTDSADKGYYVGGAGGYYVEIDGNTFLGTTGLDYRLRGYPVQNSYYHGNVSLRSQGAGGLLSTDAVQFTPCNFCITSDFPINMPGDNLFSNTGYTNPTTVLGVGDFDGDGTDDLFLATGNTWFYSPGGAREWRYLNSAPDTIDQLLFGDFDGDGRTDVVALRDGNLVVSWGGISAFDVLVQGPLPCTSISDMAVGDFNGDGKPDIFCADGKQWFWIWYGGSGSTSFVQGASSSFPRSALLFGDFDGDGTADVFAVVAGGWYYSKGATGQWADGLLQTPALPTTSGNALTIGDFNGDGIPDVATLCTTSSGPGWQISFGGTQPWTPCSPFGSSGSSFSLVNGPVGHFGGGKGAGILLWSGNGIWSFPGGTGPAQPLSSQDMR